MKRLKFFLIPFLIVTSQARANSPNPTLSFVSVWNQINENSTSQEASRLQEKSLNESVVRSSRHWLPQIYLDVKAYQTNEPGASFFGLLEQRALKQNDFNPDLINHPAAQVYTRGALGLDLPLYEGGIRVDEKAMYTHELAAQQNMTTQIQLEQYAHVGLSYGSIAVLEQQKNRLQALNTEVLQMIKSYQLGSKSNPVGYSGLLGMKSLSNRLMGLINQYEAQRKSHYALLSEMGLQNQEWVPEAVGSNIFVRRYFSEFSKLEKSAVSYKIESARENVLVTEQVASMEKAKFLPQVGAFAESTVFRADRDSATGYNVGLYLKWNLFDPSSYGRHKEAQLKSRAVAKFSEAAEQQEGAERTALTEQISSLRQNLILLDESYNLLAEQSRVTRTLFNNGSINALQFVEILNRKADLITQQCEAELGLLKVASQVITKQKFNIKDQLDTGVQNGNQ